MRGAIPSLPQYVFMAWCLVKHMHNFTFTLTKLARDVLKMGIPQLSNFAQDFSYEKLNFRLNHYCKRRG
jgi:hypothetical protein